MPTTKTTFTRRQRQVKRLLAIGCTIRGSKSINDKQVYRLMDDTINPISTVHPATVAALKRKGVLIIKNNQYVIATSQTNS